MVAHTAVAAQAIPNGIEKDCRKAHPTVFEREHDKAVMSARQRLSRLPMVVRSVSPLRLARNQAFSVPAGGDEEPWVKRSRNERRHQRPQVSATQLAQMGVCEKLVVFEHGYGKRPTGLQRTALKRGVRAHRQFLRQASHP